MHQGKRAKNNILRVFLLKKTHRCRKKKGVKIVQRAQGPTGFTAETSTGRKIAFSKNAETLATGLAKKGHKKVTILD